GVPVTGIELSPPMIARLREKADATRLPVVEGDMTTASAGEGFTLAYLVFDTLANLLTQEEQVACFCNAARQLAPGGCFVIELWVPQLRSLAPGHGGTVEVSEPGYLLVDTYDALAQQVVSHHLRFDPAVDGAHRPDHPDAAPLRMAGRARPDGAAGGLLPRVALGGLGGHRLHRRLPQPRERVPALRTLGSRA